MTNKEKMNLSFDELTVIYPQQIWINLSPEEQQNAWQQTENYSNLTSRWNAYLNYITLHYFKIWVQEDPDIQDALTVWPAEEDLPSILEIVNGIKLTLGETQFILIPTDKSSLDEFRIPQEWVDIPNWKAHYYIAVQINCDDNWMRIYGYTNYHKIKQQGNYDPIDRTYSLALEELGEDLNTMWVARELFHPQALEIQSLPIPSILQIETWIEQLSEPTYYSPRLALKFEDWATLISHPDHCKKLYQKRRLKKQNKSSVNSYEIKGNDLSLWFQNIFAAGWKSLDQFLEKEAFSGDSLMSKNLTQPIPRLAYQFRSNSTLNEFPIKTAKLIDLGMELKGTAVILLVGIALENQTKVAIRVQLHPADGETYLPPNLKLSLLSDAGVMLQEVQSRSHDNYIQLKRFKSPAGKAFSIQLSLGNANITENFVFYPA